MNKKYELTEETKEIDGHVLHRIRALKDLSFMKVNAGDLGGFIEKEDNLSHEGNCWIYDYACVYENAKVKHNAHIHDMATIHGNSKVSENAYVCGRTNISGNADVSSEANILSNNDIFTIGTILDHDLTFYKTFSGEIMVVYGYDTFLGSIQEFLPFINELPIDSNDLLEFTSAIVAAQAHLNR